MKWICIKSINYFNINDIVDIGRCKKTGCNMVSTTKDRTLIINAYNDIQIKEHFISIAEWRDNQINSILED